MKDGALSMLKVHGEFPVYSPPELASPECGSTSANSPTLATSSGCAFLMCTEDDLDDCDMDNAYAFRDEVEELCTSYRLETGGRRLHLSHIVASTGNHADASTICECIRDDLLKQAQVRQCRTAHDRACADVLCQSASGCGGAAVAAQRRLPPSYRARMVGWMREVSEALGLHLSTLFSATWLLDRFVAAAEVLVPSEMLQLLTLACMSVAVKYNEVRQLAPALWLSLAVDEGGRPLYQPRDLQRYEFTLLQTVDWRLHEPNTYTFLEHFLMCLPTAPVSIQPGPGAAVEAAGPAAAATTAAVFSPMQLVVERALALAEASRLFSSLMSYDYSTVALACLTLAERTVHGSADAGLAAAGAAAAAAAYVAATAAAAGLPLYLLAPGLEACVADLERSYGQLLGMMEAAAAARQRQG